MNKHTFKTLSWALGALLAVIQLGCSNHVAEQSRPAWVPKIAHWPELDILMRNQDPNGTSMEKMIRSMREGTGVVCHPHIGVGTKSWQENVKKFAETPIPAEYASPERETAKKALIESLNKLSDGCKAHKSDDELNKELNNAIELHKKVIEIPGQQRPTGAEGEKYAPER